MREDEQVSAWIAAWFAGLAAIALLAIAGMMIYDRVQAHSARQIVAKLRALERGCEKDQEWIRPKSAPPSPDRYAELQAYLDQMGLTSDLISKRPNAGLGDAIFALASVRPLRACHRAGHAAWARGRRTQVAEILGHGFGAAATARFSRK